MSVGSSDTTIEVSRLMGPKPGRHKGNGTRKACIFTPAPGGFLWISTSHLSSVADPLNG
jgi:hypothetical protein